MQAPPPMAPPSPGQASSTKGSSQGLEASHILILQQLHPSFTGTTPLKQLRDTRLAETPWEVPPLSGLANYSRAPAFPFAFSLHNLILRI